ncbi:probable 1-acyl-sn-glycerol-3-phosphate acyltransferase [Treponema primitia ZAS-2]|uniref:1-acyl-sn-glycerol-3-phosphate acyltransferase n=1 Tax=Treponema primitia (strain ATCC BAA-887 / DSM 12427 / ZAS-2) TaxID=545694 RepID=F5YL24_TREPZ|nr:lysophospholipid acyltransferase family protein [Treponema primitia]AEF84700.1 probable 1-acyl-sn-glycerol-3-phosphate acyltransferase [Treponema primitia ZAS-2]
MVLLRTIFVFFVTSLSMLFVFPFGIIAFLLSSLGLKKQMSFLTYKIAQGWAIVTLASTGCKLTIRGTENVPRKGGFCLVGNHNSILDIVLILATVGRPIGFIAKKELALIPFLNIWILLIGGLFIDRKNIRKAVGTINEGIGRIKAGGSMIIFPEGTRSKGQGLLPFKSGSLKLATKAGCPMVPLAIAGSYEVFEKTGRLQTGPVSVSYAPAIATAEISADEKRGLTDQVYGVIAGMLKDAP